MKNNGKIILDSGFRKDQPIALIEQKFPNNLKRYVVAFNFVVNDNDIEWGYGHYFDANEYDDAIKAFNIVINGGTLDTYDDGKLDEPVTELSFQRYKKLDSYDKSRLEEYMVYRDINDCIVDENEELTDYEIISLKEIIINFFDEDGNMTFPLTRITKFITENYLEKNLTLHELKNSEYEDLLYAIENDDFNSLKDDDYEEEYEF